MKIEELIASPNIALKLSEGLLSEIGSRCKQRFDDDKTSRGPWEEWYATAMKLALQVKEARSFPWPGCFTLDTDLLTSNGWKPVAEVAIGDLVYSRDEGGSAGFYPVKDTMRHPAKRLVHFLGKSIDLLVTENHNMLLETKMGKTLFKQAGEFIDEPVTARYIPLASHNSNKPIDTIHGIPAKSYLRFLGWYIAEGNAIYGENTYFRKKQGGFINYGRTTSSLSISQSSSANPEKCEIIKKDIEACGFTYKQHANSFTIHAKSMPQSLKDELRALGLAENKYIPRHVFKCAPSQLTELLDTLVQGDGTTSKRNKHRTYFTSSKQLADDVQELCQYIGLRGTITIRPPRQGGFIRGREITAFWPSYEISINRKPRIQVAKLTRSIVPYDGEVACVEVDPFHTLYARRNGKAVWVGNSANVKFPLLTISALNFHAKAYPALINGESVVKTRTLGPDEEGKKLKSAEKVGKDLSYQLLENSNWEEQTDKSLIVLPIMGTVFKKTVRDNNLQQNCSDVVMPQDLVVNYYTTSMDSAPSVSHILPAMTKNEMEEYIRQELFRKSDVPASQPSQDALKDAQDKSQHLIPPPNYEGNVFYPVEQCCWLDLDDDGFEEPYAVTFERDSGYVYRILARYYKNSVQRVESGTYKGKIYRIEPENYYTKYEFIPSPDGGFYGLGLGLLLGPLNESVNSAINQIFDAGTMKTLGGGFLGRGAKIKGGETTFKPFEWKSVDCPGNDLRENIVPLQVPEISPILLDLVKFLVNYGERVGGSGDIQMGELPGQNVKAETMSIANENGRLIFNAIYKRCWRAMKEEFKKYYKLRQLYLEKDLRPDNNFFQIIPEDYNFPVNCIIPVADPNITSNTEKRQVADLAYSMAHNDPGFNNYLVNRSRLEAYGVPAIDTFYPDPSGPNAIPPAPNIAMLELQVKAKKVENESLTIENKRQEAIGKLLISAQESQALIDKYEAEATMALAKAEGEKTGHAIALLDSLIGAEKTHKEHLMRMADFLKESTNDRVSGVEAA